MSFLQTSGSLRQVNDELAMLPQRQAPVICPIAAARRGGWFGCFLLRMCDSRGTRDTHVARTRARAGASVTFRALEKIPHLAPACPVDYVSV
jgi:hypothetical protein